jgi:hypothetical protein
VAPAVLKSDQAGLLNIQGRNVFIIAAALPVCVFFYKGLSNLPQEHSL